MKLAEIDKAKRTAQAFIQRCEKLDARLERGGLKYGPNLSGCKESGDLRRMSMELSRQLSKMRR